MKNLILTIICCFNLNISFSQNWQWSKKTSLPFNSWNQSNKLLTDKQGNIYSYGSSYNNSPTDTMGSYVQCYSPNGILMFLKRWKMPFHIQKMEYDGNNYFYFVARFYGAQVLDGISISSIGKSDGVVGKMNLNGQISWMKTFGGSGTDMANGICYNLTDSTMFITGGIHDTLFLNSIFQSVNPQSAIILKYTSTGNLITHKLYNFQSQNYSATNCGLEICRNQSGDLYLLMDRNGNKFWSNDSGPGPMIGRYLVKLNSNLDTLWSTYINGPQSYYGWSCNNLRVASSGDVYLTNENSSKYGGDAQLKRIDKNSGIIKWSLGNNDGLYTDVFIDSNTVYLIGNEGANGCPCQGNNPGYYIIKKIDQNNNLVGETRVFAANLNCITKKVNGGIFVSGAFGRSSCTLGPDKIMSDSTLTPYGYYQYSGNFLSKLEDLNCVAPVISITAPSIYGHYYSICPGDSAALSVNLTSGSFNWSNGSSGQNIHVGSTGFYSVSNIQANGCVAYSLPVSVIVNQNISSHKICMVTYNDSLHKNRVAVKYDDYNYADDITQINLFKKQGSSIVAVSSFSTGYNSWGTTFTDYSSHPDSGSVEYYISTIDSCGTESNLSLSHQSLFLQVANSNSNTVLNWNAYVGMPITGYKIWRGTTPTNLVLYDSLNTLQTTYSDLNSASNSFYYQVQTINQLTGCYVDQTYYRASYSNIAANNNIQVNVVKLSTSSFFEIYPNPSRGLFQISYLSDEKENIEFNIFNVRGEKLYSERVSKTNDSLEREIDLSKEAAGIYFLEVTSNEKREVKKIVLH